MAATKHLILIFSLLFLSATITLITATKTTKIDDEDGEDLSFLEEPEPPMGDDYPDYADPNYVPEGEELESAGASYEEYQAWGNQHAPPPAAYDESDVVVLNNITFGDFVTKTKHVMVQFYAPGCGYCKSLAPEYASAATELKEGGFEVVLAKVDAIQESQLADEYKVEGFPSIFLFSDGQPLPYNGDRTKAAIVSWLKKKTGSAIQNVTTTEEAEKIFAAEPKIVVAFVNSLSGPDSEELDAAAKQEDDVNFYQTTSPDVAKIFQVDPKAKRPALVLLKNEAEMLSQFDGSFSKSAIVDFVSTNKHPLVITATRETAPVVFENPIIKKQVLLFASAEESKKLIPSVQEVAKSFKGKLMFVYVERDNDDYGKIIADYFGIISDAPSVLGYANDDGRKFLMDGDVTFDKIKTFSEDFVADKLKPYYRSDPIPEINDGDVKIVVGKNFEEIVLDESKDVLLEIYAPWCPHCHTLEPAYEKLATYLRGVDSIVIAKMDGTKNEHPRAKSDGYPTILFYPAGKKSSDPIIVESDRTAVELYKFLKKNATTPFKVQKPVEAPKSEDGEPITHETTTMVIDDVKDEL